MKFPVDKLLRDEEGFVISAELILIATILCLGMVVGLTEVSRSVSNELIDVANAHNRVNQGRRYQSLGWNQGAETIEVSGRGPTPEGND